MSDVYKRYLNDALYNAGILGFVKALRSDENRDCSELVEGDSIQINGQDLEGFDKVFFQSLIQTYEKDTVFMSIMTWREKLSAIEIVDEKNEKDISDAVKFLLEKGKRASYESAYSLLAKQGNTFDFSGALDELKKTKDNDARLRAALIIMDEMRKEKEVLILKDIVYTRVQPFWQNYSFLLRTENKTDFYQAYNKSFLQPALQYVSEERKIPKKGVECCQCRELITVGEACSMSWINDEGVDINRKTSYYWNHQPDSYLCPLCALLYSCIPLGFYYQGNQGVFINQNQSVAQLESSYTTVSLARSSETADDSFYAIIRNFIIDIEETQSEKSLKNIQVIRRKDGKYYHHVFSKNMLERFARCKDLLSRISRQYYLSGTTYVSVFDQTIQRLLRNERLYTFIGDSMRACISNGRGTNFVFDLLKIQIVFKGKGDVKMYSEMAERARRNGYGLKKIMSEGEKNENKIKGLAFRLLNSLKSKNRHDFMDVLTRQYMTEGRAIPTEIICVINDEDAFLDYGYAFIVGLNGYDKESESNKEEK